MSIHRINPVVLSSNGVVLSMEGLDSLDTEGSDAVKQIGQAGQQLGIDLHLARTKTQVLEVLQRDGVIDLIGADHANADIAEVVRMHLKK